MVWNRLFKLSSHGCKHGNPRTSLLFRHFCTIKNPMRRLGNERSHQTIMRRMSMAAAGPAVHVSPSSCLVDEQVEIRVTGLSSHAPVTLAANVVENNERYVSHAHYVSDVNGNVDLTTMTSTGGSYTGLEPMGLIGSLKQAPGQRKGLRLRKKDVTSPQVVDISVVDGHATVDGDQDNALCRTSLLQWFMGPGVERHPVRKGRLRGTLFLPPGDGPFPAILDLFGTSGGLTEHRSALFASRGFASLVVPYFRYDDLPETLDCDIEYFQEGVDFLISHPKVQQTSCGVVGMSKGGEIAMTLAAVDPRVKTVVSINGTSFRIVGTVRYQGKVLPAAQFQDQIADNVVEKDGKFVFVNIVRRATGQEEAVIEVEKAENCHFLIFSSGDDNLYPPEGAQQIVDRLEAHGKKNYTLFQYPETGHVLEPPHSPLGYSHYHRLFDAEVISGGTLIPHLRAQEHFWSYLLPYLRQRLATDVSSS